MPEEIREVESQTLPRFSQPLTLTDRKYTRADSQWKAGQTYINGMQLTLALPNGTVVRTFLSKKNHLFACFEAFSIESPLQKTFAFTWDEENQRVLANSVLAK